MAIDVRSSARIELLVKTWKGLRMPRMSFPAIMNSQTRWVMIDHQSLRKAVARN
ncbi:hypothetical protein PHJA_001798900 [Phtheirospermum japonicum]|uniref:Uncharacterized protein n=1 Tax=Phtheirospermum japonicum TaxID=374723 RepID=A0A830CHF7_9LAMI|nr:hypothetical protein PHJA_001798900 [Phtheirospermum japonicum]